ncbi:MAG: type II toxin-antitoxin system PemK/MazF family toxin [Alphaproteobacteria bacterium]|nr:type II toxin-antitoxin system PemK/MazF family toxin [Alphaproteobacteria bacterium]
MKRGEVWWVAFDPAHGSEIQKTRPAVIVSNNASNRVLNRCQVVPISSRVQRLYTSESQVFIMKKFGKAMADQMRTVDKSRIKNYITTLTSDEMDGIDEIIKFQLGLS